MKTWKQQFPRGPSEDGVVADTGNTFNSPPRYTLAAGRLIERDGAPVATLHGVRPYDPVELDAFAHEIVRTLNAAPDLLATLRSIADTLAEWSDGQDWADECEHAARTAITRAEGGE